MVYRYTRLCLIVALSWPLAAGAFSFPWDKPGATKKAEPVKTSLGRPASGFVPAEPGHADRILVKKAERRLYLMRGDKPIRTYVVALGYQPTGHKRRQGDGRTPEGLYFLDRRTTASNYRKALHISYPSYQDRLHAARRGDDPGGLIMIHGQPERRDESRAGDWTFGCVAVSDMAIDEIWELTSVGTPIEILP